MGLCLVGGWAQLGQLGCLDLFILTGTFLLQDVSPGWAASQGDGSMLSPGVQVLTKPLLTLLMFH